MKKTKQPVNSQEAEFDKLQVFKMNLNTHNSLLGGLRDVELIEKEKAKQFISTLIKKERQDAKTEILAMSADERYLAGYEEGAKAGKLMVNEKLVKKERDRIKSILSIIPELIDIAGILDFGDELNKKIVEEVCK